MLNTRVYTLGLLLEGSTILEWMLNIERARALRLPQNYAMELHEVPWSPISCDAQLKAARPNNIDEA